MNLRATPVWLDLDTDLLFVDVRKKGEGSSQTADSSHASLT